MKREIKTKEIEEIDNELNKLYDQISILRNKKQELKFKEKNLEGKFIKCSRGFMFVTWQTDCKPMMKDRVMLQGLYFTTNLSESFRDSAYLDFDCLHEWYMTEDEFFSNDIKEITKDEFINEFISKFSDIKNFGLNWIDKVEKDYNSE